jgi:hypothetical protein
MRFTVRSMLFATTFVAAGVTLIVYAGRGLTATWIAAACLYWGLLIRAVYCSERSQKRHDELANKAREDGGENPTT